MYSQQSYGERCCNYPQQRASRETCSQCKYAQQVLKTFSQCQVDWDCMMENSKKTNDEVNKVIYVSWIPETVGTYVNGVKIWDKRWYVNIFSKINWFFHFKLRKNYKKFSEQKVDTKYYCKIKSLN